MRDSKNVEVTPTSIGNKFRISTICRPRSKYPEDSAKEEWKIKAVDKNIKSKITDCKIYVIQ